MGNKVQCRFCKFETNRKCTEKKNSKVKLTKKRSCSLYEGDEDKIVVYAERKTDAVKPETTFRPDWFWSRSKRRKERDRLIQQEMKKYQTTASKGLPISSERAKDSKYPVTGDLTRFITETTASNEEGD